MQLKYRGTAYTPKPPTTEYPFTVTGRFRGYPVQLGGSQPQLGSRQPHQLVYRGIPYETTH